MRALSWLLCFGCLGCAAGGGKPVSNSGGSPPVALPGSCVEPLADATGRQQAEGSEAAIPDPLRAAPTQDLDGDGQPDTLFAHGIAVISHGKLYVMRGACGHFVGDVGGPVHAALPTRSHGLVDLEALDGTMCEGARCGCEPGRLVFRFDGTEYKKDAAASKEGHEKECADGAP